MVVGPKRTKLNALLSALAGLGLAGFVLLFGSLRARAPEQLWLGWLPAALVIGLAAYAFLTRKFRSRARLLKAPFPADWRRVLLRGVPFYQSLEAADKERFEAEVRIFLAEKRITGIGTALDDETRLLVAASAVIPIFGFPEWEYDNLAEVLVYPRSFDHEMQFDARKKRNLLGLVGSAGALNRIMILSKPDLYRGFGNVRWRGNVGIHEFAHLIDGADGDVDGVPEAACPECVKPWLEVMRKEMDRLELGDSILSRYGLTSPAEFFAVASEAFFDAPEHLQEEHPELYDALARIFHQDPKGRARIALRDMLLPHPRSVGRRAKCPCGSDRRFDDCCRNRRRARAAPDD